MKYTVITGASSGIGYETAKILAKKGKSLVLVARRIDELKKLQKELKTFSTDIDVILKPVDLTESDKVYDLYNSLKELDIETWINNAGFGDFNMVKDISVSKIEKMLHLNIEALTILTSLYVRDYYNIEGTTILNVSSVGGYQIFPRSITYCATKFYVSAYTEGLAQELIQSGAKLQAKVLAPGATATEFANRSLDAVDFDYSKNVPKYHSATEVATFIDQLLNSDEIVGIVDEDNYSFKMRGPLFKYIGANN